MFRSSADLKDGMREAGGGSRCRRKFGSGDTERFRHILLEGPQLRPWSMVGTTPFFLQVHLVL